MKTLQTGAYTCSLGWCEQLVPVLHNRNQGLHSNLSSTGHQPANHLPSSPVQGWQCHTHHLKEPKLYEIFIVQGKCLCLTALFWRCNDILFWVWIKCNKSPSKLEPSCHTEGENIMWQSLLVPPKLSCQRLNDTGEVKDAVSLNYAMYLRCKPANQGCQWDKWWWCKALLWCSARIYFHPLSTVFHMKSNIVFQNPCL